MVSEPHRIFHRGDAGYVETNVGSYRLGLVYWIIRSLQLRFVVQNDVMNSLKEVDRVLVAFCVREKNTSDLVILSYLLAMSCSWSNPANSKFFVVLCMFLTDFSF
jgi:hypothetical protein